MQVKLTLAQNKHILTQLYTKKYHFLFLLAGYFSRGHFQRRRKVVKLLQTAPLSKYATNLSMFFITLKGWHLAPYRLNIIKKPFIYIHWIIPKINIRSHVTL